LWTHEAQLFFTPIFRKKYKEASLQSVTKKEQALSLTFSQSDWFISSLRDMLASAPLSGLLFTTAH
jgi:hypothetical protein